MHNTWLKDYLEEKVWIYNRREFIELDPIQIPHRFGLKQDIEISGLLTSIISWGNRKSIIRSGSLLMHYMDEAPYEFVLHHSLKDLNALKPFVHRTFNTDDLRQLLSCMQPIYRKMNSLEPIFRAGISSTDENLKNAIIHFRTMLLKPIVYSHLEKHISNPQKGSAAKRINMFLRWMVRKDSCGVDFGIWSISPALLSCPLDVHSGVVARKLELVKRKQNDWKAVEELDSALRSFDANDPVKYDFALFGLGAEPDWT